MDAPFTRSLRSLAGEGSRRAFGTLASIAVLLAVWLAWFLLARVSVYEASIEGRLVVGALAHPVQAPSDGRIVSFHMALGQAVEAGEVLAEIDSERERLEANEARARRAGIAPQLHALDQEIRAEERALAEAREAAGAASAEERARERETEAAARFAELEARRFRTLQEQGHVNELDFQRSQAVAEERRAATTSRRLGAARMELDRRARDRDREVRIEGLKRERARLEAEESTMAAAIGRLEQEVERRRVRAPVSGRIGEVVDRRVGSVVEERDRLGAVVPPGALRVQADFLPADGLGRIRRGQRGRLRLEGFPWTQYGSVPATVAGIAAEVTGGRLRVELDLDSDPGFPAPLQHGLPGTVEVEVERASPAALVLRAAGKTLARRADSR